MTLDEATALLASDDQPVKVTSTRHGVGILDRIELHARHEQDTWPATWLAVTNHGRCPLADVDVVAT